MSHTMCGRQADQKLFDLELAHAVGRAAERLRVKEIMSHSLATSRHAMALQLALDTDMPAAAAIDLLAQLPPDKPARAARRARA